jgi:uncharacterized protein YhaN
MRIRRLDLIAFGQFTGAALEIGAARGAVDLVYGANEAGKSTTLRAIFGLLFGIPEKTQDAHRHAPSDLRVGGVLEPERGGPVSLVRRKGRKATLLDPDGKPVDESVLSALLGGASAELFGAMFGLDHVTLRSSARALLEGKGSVGESLFSAGMGAHGIHSLRERLRDEADVLFTSRGRDQKIVVKAIAQVREAKKAVDDASVSARGALAQRQALEEAGREREELRERRSSLAAERARLERLLEVSPYLAERERLNGELERLGEVVLLPPDAGERRRAAVRVLEDAGQKRRRVAEDVERIEARLAEIVVPEGLVSLDEAVVRDLDGRRGRHVGAETDLPKRTGQLVALEEAVKKMLAAIDPGLAVGSVERLRIGAARSARIRKLAEERRALGADISRLSRELGAQAVKRDHLADRLVAALGPGSAFDARLLENPARLAVPPPEISDRHADDLAKIGADQAALAREQGRTEGRLRDIARDMDALRRAGDVPTERQLANARSERDAAFRPVRSASEEGTVPGRSLLDIYERSLSAADELADRLRREADRVAKLATLSAEHAALEREVEGQAERAASLTERAARLSAAFTARWAALGISPLTPAEMRTWSERFSELVDLDGERARVARELSDLQGEVSKWQSEWTESSAVLGLSLGAAPEEAIALLEATSEVLRRVDEADQIRGRIAGMKRDARAFTEDVEGLCKNRFPEGLGLPSREAAERLVRAHEKARRDDAEQRRLREELAKLRLALQSLELTEREANERVQALLKAGRAADLDALEAAERRSEAALTRAREKEAVERRLAELGDGASIDELLTRSRGLDADRTRLRMDDLDHEIEHLTEGLEDVVRRIATLEGGAARFEQADAADAASDLAEHVASLKRNVHRYVRVRLAAVLLDREIERYRQSNQGPIVERASELFPRLTLGRYTALRVGFGADDEAVLRAVRAEGGEVGVEGLSDGARDQLYLALRLASLERHARTNEPMPLVLDDVLIHFDDDRARAALGVLGDIARTTEVLFFTHHARLVELAREALGEDRLRVHTLPSP